MLSRSTRNGIEPLSFRGFQIVELRTHILWALSASTTNSTFNYERDIAAIKRSLEGICALQLTPIGYFLPDKDFSNRPW